MVNRTPGSLWPEPAWRDPGKWLNVNQLISSLQTQVEALRERVAADVLALYVACDPFVPNYLACLAAPGADFPEACSHFLQPWDSIEPIAFFPDAALDSMRSERIEDIRIRAVCEHRSDRLFAHFLVRERIVSRGRLICRDPESGRIVALLTVNFRRPVSASEWEVLSERLRSAFDELVAENAPEIRRKLQKKSRHLVPPFLGMLDIFDPLTHRSEPNGTRDLMERLLREATLPSDAPGRRWCGTVHRLTPDRRFLELVAGTDETSRSYGRLHDLSKGEGVISWVALRRQAVRIRDLSTWVFRDVSVKYLDGVRSQLAVPILVRNDLWGTLSLEDTHPNVFRRQEVGYLTRVASLAAMAVMQTELERVREERSIYLDALYANKSAAMIDEPPPTFDEATFSPLSDILS